MPDTDLTNWHLYADGDHIMVTDILRYERIADDLASLLRDMGIDETGIAAAGQGSVEAGPTTLQQDPRPCHAGPDRARRGAGDRGVRLSLARPGQGRGRGMTLDCCIISLPRTHERAMRICARLAELGIAYTVFPAVDSASDEHRAWAHYDDAFVPQTLRRAAHALGDRGLCKPLFPVAALRGQCAANAHSRR